MRDQGVGSWTARRARMTPGKTALVQDGRATSYAQLHERASRVAVGLRQRGIGRGDRVAFLGLNSAELVITMFATARLGAAFLPVNTRLAPPELAFVLSDAGARLLIWDTELAAGAAGIIRGELPMPGGGAGLPALQRTADASGLAGAIAVDLPARLRNQARSMSAASGAEGRYEPGISPAPTGAAMSVEHAEPLPATNGASVASPNGASAPSSGASTVSVSGSDPDDRRPPYVPPDAWRSNQPIRLDAQLLRGADPTSPAPDPPEQP